MYVCIGIYMYTYACTTVYVCIYIYIHTLHTCTFGDSDTRVLSTFRTKHSEPCCRQGSALQLHFLNSKLPFGSFRSQEFKARAEKNTVG